MIKSLWAKYASVSVLMAAFTAVHAYQAINFDLNKEFESQQKNGFAPKTCVDRYTITPLNIGNEFIRPEELKEKYNKCLKEESMVAAEKMLPSHISAVFGGSIFSLAAGIGACRLFRQRKRDQKGPDPK